MSIGVAPCLFLSYVLLISSSSVQCKGNLTLGLLLPYETAVGTGSNFNAGKWYASAIVLALEKVNSDPNFLPEIQINFIWNDTECMEETGLRQMTEQLEKKVDGFVGFGCTCATQARLGAALNMPVISYVSIISQVDSIADKFIGVVM